MSDHDRAHSDGDSTGGSDSPEPRQLTSAEALEAAYALETPDDNRVLYRDWASTYDAEFIDATGYVYATNVARVFDQYSDATTGALLDVGCGTGGVGVELRALGREPVDGVDISPEMMAVAATKRTADGEAVYRELAEADLTVGIDAADGSYAGVLSAGTFTFGHLGPESIDELLRVAAPGATLTVGVNADHYREEGFEARFAADFEAGHITRPVLVDVAIYTQDVGDHSDTRALVAVFQRR